MPQRLDGMLQPRIGGHDDDRYLGIQGTYPRQQLETVHPGHSQIGDHHVGAVALEVAQCLRGIPKRLAAVG